MKYLFIIIAISLSSSTYAAQCQVNGKWYPYSDPICSGNGSNSRSPAKPQLQAETNSPNPVCNIPENKAFADIKAKLNAKYPDSYSLQKTLYDANVKSYRFLCSEPATDINIRILNKRLSKYYPSFSLMQTLYEADKKAFNELNQ